jgi:hypothetical protein
MGDGEAWSAGNKAWLAGEASAAGETWVAGEAEEEGDKRDER